MRTIACGARLSGRCTVRKLSKVPALTPWAALGIRPSAATDLSVRQRFHVLSRSQHPDRPGADGVPGPDWYRLTAAYGAVKTDVLRAGWAAMQARFSGGCAACSGSGVAPGRNKTPVALCGACRGAGRVGLHNSLDAV